MREELRRWTSAVSEYQTGTGTFVQLWDVTERPMLGLTRVDHNGNLRVSFRIPITAAQLRGLADEIDVRSGAREDGS